MLAGAFLRHAHQDVWRLAPMSRASTPLGASPEQAVDGRTFACEDVLRTFVLVKTCFALLSGHDDGMRPCYFGCCRHNFAPRQLHPAALEFAGWE